MMVQQRWMRARLFTRATSITRLQYSSACALISSEAHRKRTFCMSMPMAFQISIMYWPIMRIFLRSPSILLFNWANQSATQNLNRQPVEVSLFTLMARSTPWAMCMRPEGSKPSYTMGCWREVKRAVSSSTVRVSSPTLIAILTFSSTLKLETNRFSSTGAGAATADFFLGTGWSTDLVSTTENLLDLLTFTWVVGVKERSANLTSTVCAPAPGPLHT
mmetsp:Transcript_59867/g.105265  ORF Transcript_59867/g.105265 Transcript_59867/m.105265 type:complete len:218 (-) Transcript_59867:34-687(-)